MAEVVAPAVASAATADPPPAALALLVGLLLLLCQQLVHAFLQVGGHSLFVVS